MNTKSWFRILVVLVVSLLTWSQDSFAHSPIPGEFLVRYREEPSRLFAAGPVGAPADVHLLSDYR